MNLLVTFLICTALFLSPEKESDYCHNHISTVSDTLTGSIQLAEDLVILPLFNDVYLAVHSFPWPANSLIIKGSRELLFIDTPYNDVASELLLNWFQRDSVQRKIIVINTHFHNDNLGGNSFFISRGADVYGSEKTVELLQARGLGNGILEILKNSSPEHYNYFKDVRLSPPNRTFNLLSGLNIECCDDSVEVYFPGAGHTPDNVVVFVKKRKILFGGCIIKSLGSTTKGNTGDAVLEEWPSSVRNIIKKYPEASVVIPGHGDPGDLKLLEHTFRLVKP